MNTSKIRQNLDWSPKETFESAIFITVQWFLDNQQWWSRIVNGTYQGTYQGQRLRLMK